MEQVGRRSKSHSNTQTLCTRARGVDQRGAAVRRLSSLKAMPTRKCLVCSVLRSVSGDAIAMQHAHVVRVQVCVTYSYLYLYLYPYPYVTLYLFAWRGAGGEVTPRQQGSRAVESRVKGTQFRERMLLVVSGEVAKWKALKADEAEDSK